MGRNERAADTDGDLWDAVARAWRRRDSGPIRILVEHELGPESLKAWRELSQAVFEDHKPERLMNALWGENVDPARLDGDDEALWRQYASAAVLSLEDAAGALPADSRPPAQALLAAFVYFEILCFWEHSAGYPKFRGVISALENLHERAGGEVAATSDRCGLLFTAAHDLAQSLRAQFEVEMALGCSCPVLFARAAPAAAERLGRVVDDLERLAEVRSLDDSDRVDGWETTLRGLQEILVEDARHTHGYFAVLHEHVGPAAGAFVANLAARGNDPAVIRQLEAAMAAAAAYEGDVAGQAGVFTTEARAQRATLTAMRDRLAAGEPSLRVSEGEIVLIYPFSLPISNQGDRLVHHLMTSHESGPTGFALAGADAHLDDAPRSGMWIRGGTDEVLDSGLRLTFDKHVLVLETTSGLRYRDLDVEVRLNGLGNHFVHIAVSTGTEVDLRDVPDAARPAGSAWTPHDIDQWARRVGYDIGAERIWFEPRGERGPAHDSSTEPYEHLVDLVQVLVGDLVHVAPDGGRDRDETPATDKPGDDETSGTAETGGDDAEEVGDLELRHVRQATTVHARVVAVITGLERVAPDGEVRRVTDPAEVPGLIGASTLLTGQRRYPTGLEEWVRARIPPVENLLGEDGLADELVAHNENLTLVLAAFTPNWQVIRYLELIEFVDSLAGSYSGWARWLSTTATRAGRELPDAGVDLDHGILLQQSADLVFRQSQVQALLGYVRSRELLYNGRDRRFVDRLMASGRLTHLEDEVTRALLTLRSHQEWVSAQLQRAVERREQRKEDARRRRESVFNGFIGLVAVLGFFELFSWLNNEREWTGTGRVFWLELVVVLVVVAAGTGLLVYMHKEDNSSDP